MDSIFGALKWLDRNFELYIASALIIVYTCLIGYIIVARALGLTALWGQTVVVGMFIWMTWLGSSKAIKDGDHLRFTLVRDKMSPLQNYIIYWIEWILWVAFAGIIVWYSIPMVQRSIGRGALISGTSIPRWLILLAIPVGFTLMIVRVVQQCIVVTRRYRAGEDISVEIEMTTS